jgi:hypothetical protein
MRHPARPFMMSAAVLLAGCASSNPPLLFGDHASFGLHLGNDNASGGAAVSLGYKHRSVAVVPVSALNKHGAANAIAAHDDDDSNGDRITDALSVFAVFEGSASGSTPNEPVVRLGQVFSTGLAAQMLTKGYDCRAHADLKCERPRANAAAKPTAVIAAPAVAAAVPAAGAANSASAGDGPYQRPLVFMRNDVYGFDIGASVAEQGGQFALGYSSRNVALIPVVLVSADGQVSRLLADGEGTGWRDAYSVMGQFRSDTETRRVGFNLERYFATGMAARNLGSGLQATIANGGASKTATAAQPTASQPAPALSVHTAANE